MDEATALMEMLFNKDVWFHETDCNWESVISNNYCCPGGTAIFRVLEKTMQHEDLELLQQYFAGDISIEGLENLYLLAYGMRWDE